MQECVGCSIFHIGFYVGGGGGGEAMTCAYLKHESLGEGSGGITFSKNDS